MDHRFVVFQTLAGTIRVVNRDSVKCLKASSHKSTDIITDTCTINVLGSVFRTTLSLEFGDSASEIKLVERLILSYSNLLPGGMTTLKLSPDKDKAYYKVTYSLIMYDNSGRLRGVSHCQRVKRKTITKMYFSGEMKNWVKMFASRARKNFHKVCDEAIRNRKPFYKRWLSKLFNKENINEKDGICKKD